MTADPIGETPHFTLIVSEKGGSERRENFEAAEITVGRVQGNDLVLPKGNVSKRHCRILYREGRFIVTDLNSTNGTYVNRRRIAQATIIREEDRLYVGDFVISVVGELSDEDRDEAPDTPTAMHEVGPPPGTTLSPDSGAERPHSSAPSWGDRLSAADQLSRASSMPAGAGPSSAPPGTIDRGISEPPQDSSGRFADMSTGHRRAVAEVVSQVLQEVGEPDLDPASEYAGAVRARAERVADQLLVSGQIPVGTSAEAVGEQAIEELLGLGPLEELVNDPAVQMIAAARFDELTGTRDGRQQSFPPGFSQVKSFELALQRLCARSGVGIKENEEVVERTLADGTRLAILRGSLSPTGPLLTLRKPRKITSSLDDLVRRGTVSRAMATFLNQCVAGHLNVLVVGPRDEGAHVVLAALCAATTRERIVAVTDFDDLMAQHESTVRLDLGEYEGDARRLLEIAASIPQTRLAVTLANSDLSAATVEATGAGVSGLLASLHAANLNRGLLRLPADIVAERPGMGLEAATGWVLSAFDVVIEVTRLRDGRIRVLRIGELVADGQGGIAVSDIFRFVVSRVAAGGAVEGSFAPSGQVPHVASQLEALGMRMDASLFLRAPAR